jgi:hypothetical protein
LKAAVKEKMQSYFDELGFIEFLSMTEDALAKDAQQSFTMIHTKAIGVVNDLCEKLFQ